MKIEYSGKEGKRWIYTLNFNISNYSHVNFSVYPREYKYLSIKDLNFIELSDSMFAPLS